MNMGLNMSKLRELRERTDRDLITLINMQLDRGLAVRGSEAEKIYLDVAPLLLVANPNRRERARLEAKLEELTDAFEPLCMTA
jgi:hypothetical protein